MEPQEMAVFLQNDRKWRFSYATPTNCGFPMEPRKKAVFVMEPQEIVVFLWNPKKLRFSYRTTQNVGFPMEPQELRFSYRTPGNCGFPINHQEMAVFLWNTRKWRFSYRTTGNCGFPMGRQVFLWNHRQFAVYRNCRKLRFLHPQIRAVFLWMGGLLMNPQDMGGFPLEPTGNLFW